MSKNNFELTSIVWHKVQDKVDVEPLEILLNKHLSLSNYGNSIKKVYFVFIAVRPENNLHKNRVEFHSDTGTLEVALKLIYEHIVNSSFEEVQRMMFSLFKRSIDLFDKLNPSDFALERFRKDMEKLLK